MRTFCVQVDRYDCSSAISLSLSIPEQTSETEKCEEAYQHCYVQKHFFFYEEGYISKTNPDPVVEEFDDSIIRCMN